MPTVYILLPVHNRRELTRGFIESLSAQTFSDFHLLLIDDGSTDGTEEMVRARIKNVSVLKGGGDWWWGGSLQQGLDWLRHAAISDDDIVLTINDDVSIPPDFIAMGCAQLKPHSMLQAVVCSEATHEILDVGMVYEDRKMLFRPALPGESINCLTTNGLFCRWRDVQFVGGFYPRLLPHYLSDYEFTMRAHRKGLKLLVSPDIKLYWNQGTTGYRTINEDALIPFLKKFFSKRAAGNPIYWTTFVFLASSKKYLLLHLVKIWATAFYIIGKKMLRISPAKGGAA